MIKKITAAVTAVVLIMSFMPLWTAADTAPVIYFDMSRYSIPEKGEEFSLLIKAINYEEIFSYELLIDFEEKYISAVDIEGNAGGTEAIKEIDNEQGSIKYIFCVNDGELDNNILARVTFEVKEIGIANAVINRNSKFLRKADKDDKTAECDIQPVWNYGSDYPSSVDFTVGKVEKPRFVTKNNQTVFPYSLEVSFEQPKEKGVEIYYTTSSKGIPGTDYDEYDLDKYFFDEPIVLSNTTTITAVAVKNGVYSGTASKKFTRDTSGLGGGSKGTGTGSIITNPNQNDNLSQQSQQTEKFADIKDHWSKEYFEKLIKKGIVGGYEDNTIRPDNRITRAEAAKIIASAINLSPAEDDGLSFIDSEQIADWARGYIKAAVQKGIITGYEDNSFKPNEFVTRSELIVLAARAFSLGEANADDLVFEDKALIPGWAAGSVAEAVRLGIISGYEDNTFRPGNYVTRAEAAKIIIGCTEL